MDLIHSLFSLMIVVALLAFFFAAVYSLLGILDGMFDDKS